MTLDALHPATAAWFRKCFAAPTGTQTAAWPAIREGRHTLIAAPTGSGKTLAAFLSAIDALVCEGTTHGLPDECRVLYVSPLKALSNDIQKNLQIPLEGIRNELFETDQPDVEIRAWVRTGDTPQAERERMRRTPPHIVVTTPESLYILLTSDSGRKLLSTVREVIVDEIHALAGNKRGAHLALSLERLTALTPQPPVRIGLSATQKPIEEVANFLVGGAACNIINTGHTRERQLHLELPRSPLAPVMANEVWSEVYDRLAELVRAHRTTLIFVNNRRQAERAARHLAERIGEEHVTSHHGSLARKHRLDAEQRLKRGELKALVATASLELGIDIGDVDLVCQLGSPRNIGTFLQRVGRSGHALGAVPEGRLFPLSRDDLVDCAALLDAARRGELDALRVPDAPLDVLAQQLVAEVACREWDEATLFETCRRAWPYRKLTREDYTEVVQMLAEGYATRRERRGAHLHRDAVNGKLRGRRGAKLIAVTNGGAIPDQFDYDVILSPSGLRVGTLNEDFSFESIPGDIFQLGNTSYRILKVEQGRVLVEDAHGAPPNIPFWFGEAPARSMELSLAVSRLRARAEQHLAAGKNLAEHLADELQLETAAAQQLAEYLAAARAALGVLPTQDTVVFERFFDEAGDQHFVIHAPFGARINRAWGLALRKRFCRKFNFELQAAALEDSIVLSLGATHSFPLDEPARYLNPATALDVLVQAVLAAPMFGTRWRWVTTNALAVRRNRNGKRMPPAFQRADAEDLVALIFPDQLACAENLAGAREVPDHPLVRQTLNDCLHDVMDADGLLRILERLHSGELKVVTRDLAAPSPLAQEILSARPYAFLDDAPAEERRTLAVQSRGVMSIEEAGSLAALDAEAIARVRAEVWPAPRDVDELHDALMIAGFLTGREVEQITSVEGGLHFAQQLAAVHRATCASLLDGKRFWIATERLHEWLVVFPDAELAPTLEPLIDASAVTREDALRELLRGRLSISGPITVNELVEMLGLGGSDIDVALLALEAEGSLMRGRYTQTTTETEWCERGLLARIHRYTLKRLRSEIEPVAPADYLRFLFDWHGVGAERGEGQSALATALEQMEGFSAPAAAWECGILAARVGDYAPYMLDQLCAGGSVAWMRLVPPRGGDDERRAGPVRGTPIAFVAREALSHWRTLSTAPDPDTVTLSHSAQTVQTALQQHGALFFSDLVKRTGLLRSQVESALGELAAWGLASADSFTGLRALITPQSKRTPSARSARYRLRRGAAPGVNEAGRWALAPQRMMAEETANNGDALAHVAEVLLRRYGVVFRKVLERESGLPPWRDLLYIYRRLEARGEVRGGRFVDGFSGEQFALPEAVGALRNARKQPRDGTLISVSAADVLNLTGIITPGQRVPAQGDNRVLYRDGIPVAVQIAEEVHFLEAVTPEAEWSLRTHLLRNRQPVSPISRQ